MMLAFPCHGPPRFAEQGAPRARHTFGVTAKLSIARHLLLFWLLVSYSISMKPRKYILSLQGFLNNLDRSRGPGMVSGALGLTRARRQHPNFPELPKALNGGPKATITIPIWFN